MTATATRPKPKVRRKRKKAARANPQSSIANPQSGVSPKWRKLFADHLPGYDPFAHADGCYFDEQAAERAIGFFPAVLKHAKGRQAGEPFVLEPWEQAWIGAVYGWKKADGKRRYQIVFVYVPKKNGKTALCAGLVVRALTQDHKMGAEIYSAAASREQAALVFDHAKGMIRQQDDLNDMLTIYGEHGGSVMRSITNPEERSAYKCLASDANTADGSAAWLAVIDELHRHKNGELASVLHKGTAEQDEALTIYITTADWARPSLCNTKLKYAKQVRDNGGDASKPGFDAAFLPVVYEASKDDDWEDPAVWRKANPNLDVTVTSEFLAGEARRVKDTPSERDDFLRLHLNIVTDACGALLDLAQWDACAPPVESLGAAPCFTGLDLSATRDITAFCLYWPEEAGGGTVKPWFFMPEEEARRQTREHNIPYVMWAEQGYIELTPGNVVDHGRVKQRFKEVAEQHNIREVAIDRWNSTQLQTELMADGFNVVTFGQGYASMTAPCKEIERLVVAGLLRHGGHPVLRWMAGNVVAARDPAGNLKFDKSKSGGKIDGLVALAMAVGRALVAEGDGTSVYEERGVI